MTTIQEALKKLNENTVKQKGKYKYLNEAVYDVTYHDGPMSSRSKQVIITADTKEEAEQQIFSRPEAKEYSNVSWSEHVSGVTGYAVAFEDIYYWDGKPDFKNQPYDERIFVKAKDAQQARRFYMKHYFGKFHSIQHTHELFDNPAEKGQSMRCGKVIEIYQVSTNPEYVEKIKLDATNESCNHLTEEQVVHTYEEAQQEVARKEAFLERKKQEIEDLVQKGISFGPTLNKTKGKIKSISFEVVNKEVHPNQWENLLVHKIKAEKNDGSEIEITAEELIKEYGSAFVKGDFRATNLVARIQEVVNAFKSLEKARDVEARLRPSKEDSGKRTGRVPLSKMIGNKDPNDVGEAWAEISQHPDWIEWIYDNVDYISARAPVTKVKKAQALLGHERVYPANTWGWSFAITFKDITDCPFERLLSSDGKLCSVATVINLFAGSSYRSFFSASKDDREPDEFVED